MGGGGKGGGGGGGGEIPDTTTTTTKWSPPDYLGGRYGPLNSYMSYAAQVLGKPFNPYTGQTQGGPSTDTQMGWQIARQRALNGNQLAQHSDQVYKDTMSGAYMHPNSNPYLQGALDYTQQDTTRNFNQAVAPQMNNAFARSKAFGGSAYNQQMGEAQRNLANELGRNASNAYLGNYNQERANQIGMMDYADRAGQRDYNDANMLMNIGQQSGNYLNNYLGQGQTDFNNANNFLTNNLNQFGNVYGGLSGQGNSSTTSTNPNAGQGGNNPLAMGLGAAQTGMGIYGMGKNLGWWGAGSGLGGGGIQNAISLAQIGAGGFDPWSTLFGGK